MTSGTGTQQSASGKAGGLCGVLPARPVEVGAGGPPRDPEPASGPAHWLVHRLVVSRLLGRAAILLPAGEGQFTRVAQYPVAGAAALSSPKATASESGQEDWLDEAALAAERVTGLGGGPPSKGPVVVPRPVVGKSVDVEHQSLLVAFDLTFGGPSPRALVGTLRSLDRAALMDRLRQIELVAMLAKLHDAELEAQTQRDACQRIARAMEVAAVVGRHESFRPSALELCDHVASLWKTRRVALGVTHSSSGGGDGASGGVRLQAINGVDHFVRRMNATKSLEAVMDECADQGEFTCFPPPEHSDVVCREAKRHSQEQHAGQVCCLPFALESRLGGVLLLETEPDEALDGGGIDALQVLLDLCGGTIMQRYQSSRWFGARLVTAFRRHAATWLGPHHTWMKLLGLCLAAALVFLVVGKGTYRVDAPFVIEPTTRFVLSTPFEGELESVAVVPGDLVTAGQSLAQFRTTEIRVELASRRAEQRRWIEEADMAVREGKAAEAQVAQAKSDQAAAKVELLSLQLSRAGIAAPVDGVVIDGDLRQQVGGTLRQGDPLFEVAPLNDLQAKVMVPEGRIADVVVGQHGQIAVAANPSQRVGFVVQRIEPMAQVKEAQNVFPVWIELDERPVWLMPGMEGVAKVDIDRRHYAWIWTRSAVDWLRMKLWW